MRRKDIDWLRLFGILLLFPFHAARVFDSREANYIHSDAASAAGIAFMNVIWPWFMPLLFLVAGISAWHALQKRNAGRFLKERVVRLLVPLILGIVFIVPIQGYVARLQRGTLNGGYITYLFTQFFPDFSDISGYHGTFTPAHLWFILYLFVISCALLPLFAQVVRSQQVKGIGRFGQLFAKPWFLMLLFVPLTISEALPDIGGKNPIFYGLYYTFGFFIAANDGSLQAIDRLKWWTLGAVLASMPAYLAIRGVAGGLGDFAWQSILLALLRNFYGICALLAMLAFSRQHLNHGGKVLDYLNQAAFPVYILHQSVMMVIAYFVLMWDAGITLQYVAISLLTLLASLLLYEGARHIAPLRLVLGIKGAREKLPGLKGLPGRIAE